jgi:hypothetical protein
MGNKWSRIAMMGLIVAVGAGYIAAGEKEQVFIGDIGDSQCALNIHSLSRSHQEMLAKKSIGTTPEDCARYCVKEMGGVYVLQVKEKVYKLDNQDLADKYAGTKVKLVGVLDSATNTITVRSMEPTK